MDDAGVDGKTRGVSHGHVHTDDRVLSLRAGWRVEVVAVRSQVGKLIQQARVVNLLVKLHPPPRGVQGRPEQPRLAPSGSQVESLV